ncbi:MAG: MFS transporter, partial [Pararhizobium sp.]
RCDRVLVDAPCTGSGTWRRRPETKWRLTERSLGERLAQQREVLADAARYVRPGGTLVYVTCSVLPEENTGQVDAFLIENPAFAPVSLPPLWAEIHGPDKPAPHSADGNSLLLSPARTGTDGFFISVLQRSTA